MKYLLFSLTFVATTFLFKDLKVYYILYAICVVITSAFIYLLLLFITKDSCLLEMLHRLKLDKIIKINKNK